MDPKPIVVSKIGADHSHWDINRQDFGIMFRNVKLSLDGCGSCKFSDVGVGLFAQALSKRTDIAVATFDHIVYEEMHRLVDCLGFTDEDLLENFCFTILAVIETDVEFVVFSCGDGYIFAINDANELEVIDLDYGYDNRPPYFVYNLVDPDSLSSYKDGVRFDIHYFPKTDYVNVGVGSDGCRFVENLDEAERARFEEALLAGKPGRIGQIINRNAAVFKDDITIVL